MPLLSTCSGRWQGPQTPNAFNVCAPIAVESFVASKRSNGTSSCGGSFVVSRTTVDHLFSLLPTRLVLDRCRFADDGAFDAFALEIGRSTTLSSLSISGCCEADGTPMKRSTSLVLWGALLESTTIEALDVSSLQLSEADAEFLAENVIPWNRTIVDWNLSGNPDLGDKGVALIVNALVSGASSIQRLNLRRCGLQRDGLLYVLNELRSLTSLQQLDVAMNGGYHDPSVIALLGDVGEVLHRNCKLMHPGDVISHTALYEPASVEMLAVDDIRADHMEETKPDIAPVQKRRRSAGAIGTACAAEHSTIAQQTSSIRRGSTASSAQLERKPSQRSPTVHGQGAAAQRASSFRGSRGPQAPSPRRKSVSMVEPAESAPSAAPTVMPEVSLVDVSAISTDTAVDDVESTTIMASSGSVPPCKQPPQRRFSDPLAPPARTAVAANASPQRSGAHSLRTPQQQSVSIQDLNDGAEDWRRVKEHYNSYIRSGSPSASSRRSGSASSPMRRAALQTPKYVLGKLVNRDKSTQPTSAFHPTSNGSVMYVREPMPAERRRYAPWVNASSPARSGTPSSREGAPSSPSASPTAANRCSSYIGNHVTIMDTRDAKHQTAIRIVDGGDITMIQDDPRDMGYLSRKVQSGATVLRPSPGFASNTTREVRWGVDPTSQVPRTAQAPPPGTYNVPSSFELAERKARASARATTATGKKCFGVSGSVRTVYDVADSGAPGPGFYEIP